MESEIDYKKEVAELKQHTPRDWWKPTQGKYEIEFLSNGEKYVTEWEGKDIVKVRFDILVKPFGQAVPKQQYSWGVTLGTTPNSLWGQICLVANNAGGQLQGGNITLLVKGQKKETNYTVEEALSLQPPQQEQVH